MNLNDLAVIVLAAGRGVRFGESYSKLLHPVLGKPLIYYPAQNLKNLGVENIIAVVSDSKVEAEIEKYIDCKFVYQKNLTGTADAVKLALDKISLTPLRWKAKILMVLNGDDATLYSKKTLEEFLKSHELTKSDISLMTIKTRRQMDVGRIIRDKKNNFSKILEYREYLESGVHSKEINCGVYLINLDFARENLPKIRKNPNGEYYLTDLLNLAKEQGGRINLYILKNHSEWIGVNSKKDLKYAEESIKRRNLVTQQKQTPTLKVHFLGIAGSGASACAKIAEKTGFKVTGCDKHLFRSRSENSIALAQRSLPSANAEGKSFASEFVKGLQGIPVAEGHDPKHLDGVDILAITPAILSLDPDNAELLEAKKRKIKILTWQQFLGKYLTKNKFVIAIAGTHGKSTTTAMVGKMLEDCGFDPTALLGANTSFWDNNFKTGRSKYFVVEADEFNDNYMSLNPNITIITNIEFDHPEYFKDFISYERSFQNFLHKTSDLIIANLSDQNTKDTLKEKPKAKEPFFPPVVDFSKNLIDFPLKVSGIHNIYAASAAFNLGLNLEIDPDKIQKSLQNFPGIGRRMELLGEINGAKVFSDFAHHPTEIEVTIEALRQKHHDRNIIVFFQPHMFSRTKALFNDFVEVFKNLPVKKAYILDVYPSREVDTGIVNSKQLVEAVGKENVKYFKDERDAFQKLTNQLRSNDVVVFMGAGDIDSKIRSHLSS